MPWWIERSTEKKHLYRDKGRTNLTRDRKKQSELLKSFPLEDRMRTRHILSQHVVPYMGGTDTIWIVLSVASWTLVIECMNGYMGLHKSRTSKSLLDDGLLYFLRTNLIKCKFFRRTNLTILTCFRQSSEYNTCFVFIRGTAMIYKFHSLSDKV